MSEYAVGEVMTGEVLPMRANPSESDVLGPDFDRTLHEVMDDPWDVLPPDEWTHRSANADRDPTFAQALNEATPEQIRKLVIKSSTAMPRALARVAGNAARRAGKRIR